MPSLEDALRDQQLGPVHDTLRGVIADPSRATVERFVAAVAEATGTGGDVVAVVERIVERAARAEPVIAAVDDPSHMAALRLWTMLAPLGSLPDGAPVGPTSRAWYDELRLSPVVADALRSRGLDESQAWWAAERVRTLLDLPLPSHAGGPAATLPLRLVDAWLAHPAVRPFIRVNAWDGVEWFHRESWDELLVWVDRLELILALPDEPARKAAQRRALLERLAEAAETSGYRVDRLRVELGAAPVAVVEPGPPAKPVARGRDRDPDRACVRGGACARQECEAAQGGQAGARGRDCGRREELEARQGGDKARQEGRQGREEREAGQGQAAQEVEVATSTGSPARTVTEPRTGPPGRCTPRGARASRRPRRRRPAVARGAPREHPLLPTVTGDQLCRVP